MKKKKIIIWVGVIVLILLLITFMRRGRGGEDIVTTEMSTLRTITETVAANGKIQPEGEVKISSDLSGEIVELNIREGDFVNKGDVLAKINPEIYESAMNRADAALNNALANLANSKARVAQSEAQYKVAKLNYERNQKLHEQGAISDSEFDNIESNFEVAKAEVEAAVQTKVAAEFNVKSAEASAKEAAENLRRTTIYSPQTGTVSSLLVEQGERVVGTAQMAGTEMMRIANLKVMEVEVDVNENDIVRVKDGDTAIIEVDAFLGRKFKGIVTEIASSAQSTGTNIEQVTNFLVKIRVLQQSYGDLVKSDTLNSPFKPGMSANVEIQTKTRENVVTVPIGAVTTRSADAQGSDKIADKFLGSNNMDDDMMECVFVLENGKAVLTPVKTGIQDSRYIEITDGLDEGVEVITGPYDSVSRRLTDGSEVAKKTGIVSE